MADRCLFAVTCLKEAAGGRLCGDVVSPVAGVWPETALGENSRLENLSYIIEEKGQRGRAYGIDQSLHDRAQ